MKCPRCGEALEEDAICEFCNEPTSEHGEGEEYDNMREADDAYDAED